jgi:hypothetical protein
VLLDDSSDVGRLIVLIEAIDRPRLLNDVTSIITDESKFFSSFVGHLFLVEVSHSFVVAISRF